MNPLLLRPDRFFNYIWTWAEDRVDHEKNPMWAEQMFAPIPGRSEEVMSAAAATRIQEEELGAFDQFRAAVTAG